MESFTQLPGPKVPAFRRSLKQWEQDLPQRHNDQPWGYEVLNSTHIKITKADEPFRMQKALPLMSAYSLLVLSMNHSTKTPLTLHARCLCIRRHLLHPSSSCMAEPAPGIPSTHQTPTLPERRIQRRQSQLCHFYCQPSPGTWQKLIKNSWHIAAEVHPKIPRSFLYTTVLGIPTHGNAKSVPHSSRSRWR